MLRMDFSRNWRRNRGRSSVGWFSGRLKKQSRTSRRNVRQDHGTSHNLHRTKGHSIEEKIPGMGLNFTSEQITPGYENHLKGAPCHTVLTVHLDNQI